MSLFGALQTGASGLLAQQAALQVTGNNIANAGTAGYSRQVVNLTANPEVESSSGQYVGTGVGVGSIQRQVSESLNESLREANSGQSAATTLNSQLTQLQTTFGPLNQNDLASQMTSFFNSFSSLANNPTDASQQAVVIQSGVSLAENLQNLRSQVSTLSSNADAQVGTLAQQANSLAQQIAGLNSQIDSTGPNGSNSLEDQRDQALSQLSQIMDIRVVNQGSGNLNVYVGSTPLVQGTTTRGVSTTQTTDPTSQTTTTQVVFGDNGDPMNVTGGQLGGVIDARDNYLTPAINTIDSVAAGLISVVNSIHTQGQGAQGFSSVTGTAQVLDPTAALNAPATQTGIAFPPTNGSFDLYMTDSTTGQTTTQQINVNLSGQGTQTSLNSLAASITAAGGGTVSATVNPAGNLVISSNDPDVTVGFGNDTSGALASLGINTFFSGSNASNIAVNSTLVNNPGYLATGRGNVTGSNQNAQALALAGAATSSQLGGQSLTDYYAGYIGNLAAQSQNVSDNATAQGTIYNTFLTQQQAVSGVSMDDETVNLMQYQRAFEGSAQYINIVNQMMTSVLDMIP